MSQFLARVRSLRASALGRYIPNNKVLAGLLASGVVLALGKLGVVHVPLAYVSVGAFLLVSYLLPESPVAAAHVVAKAGVVTVQRIAKVAGTVDVSTSPAYKNLVPPVAAEQPGPSAVQSGVQAPYVGPSQA